jgi:hypothetical protein
MRDMPLINYELVDISTLSRARNGAVSEGLFQPNLTN